MTLSYKQRGYLQKLPKDHAKRQGNLAHRCERCRAPDRQDGLRSKAVDDLPGRGDIRQSVSQ